MDDIVKRTYTLFCGEYYELVRDDFFVGIINLKSRLHGRSLCYDSEYSRFLLDHVIFDNLKDLKEYSGRELIASRTISFNKKSEEDRELYLWLSDRVDKNGFIKKVLLKEMKESKNEK